MRFGYDRTHRPSRHPRMGQSTGHGQAAERFVVLVGFTKAARQGNATSHIVPVRGLFSLRV